MASALDHWRAARDAFRHCADHCELVLPMLENGGIPDGAAVGKAVVEIANWSNDGGVENLIAAACKMGFVFTDESE